MRTFLIIRQGGRTNLLGAD